MTIRHILLLLLLLGVGFGESTAKAKDDLAGRWQLTLRDGDIAIRCGLELAKQNEGWSAMLINGEERLPIDANVSAKSVTLSIPHYDSALEFVIVRDNNGIPVMDGIWKKRRGPNEWVRMKAQATIGGKLQSDADFARRFAGRWKVNFSKSDDPAVGIFRVNDDGELAGTFLTTTGDYRFLAGRASDKKMTLSCFDGSHAFSFVGRLTEDGKIEGDFWSSNTWHENFKASRDENASLPDSFRQTIVNQNVRLGDFEFPDVNGKPVNLDGKTFRGKPRLIYVFGSWCPNCHDAAAYLSELDRTYSDRGLSILGIAFELTGDFKRDAEQVKRYLARHECEYSVVIAGTADKRRASRTFPLLDRIRSYPTTIFIDRSGTVTAVHTGFTGPATGAAYTELKQQFQVEIESLLKDQ